MKHDQNNTHTSVKNNDTEDDVRTLERMGYKQELLRRMGGFSNFAISFSIICILAGGVTSFHLALCATGGASIGIGWPVGCLIALAVALTMGQVASAFPTAGGLYHWSSILGGKGWGWATAWFNLVGLATVLAAINVGFYEFAIAAISALDPSFLRPGDWVQHACVAAITLSQAFLNHRAPGLTIKLTDFSGWWILSVSVLLTITLMASVDSWEFSRLIQFENYSGFPAESTDNPTGPVWPQTANIAWLFCLGLMLPLYTITGFDASAHTAEETIGAARQVPRGIVRSVVVSGIFGWIMLCGAVLAIPDMKEAANLGPGAFFHSVTDDLPRWQSQCLFLAIGLAQYLCGLATVTSASRMVYAFARDGGLPASNWLKKIGANGTPGPAIFTLALFSLAFTWHTPVYSTITLVTTIFLYVSYLMPTVAGLVVHRHVNWGPWSLGFWYYPLSVVAILGCVLLVALGTAPPNEEAAYLLVGFVVLLLAAWFGGMRTRFRGPPKMTP